MRSAPFLCGAVIKHALQARFGFFRRTHPRNSDQTRPRHPQVRQRGQRDNLRRVLGQAPVAHLVEAELLLDHLERVRDLELRLDERIEQSALARAHRYMAKSGLSLQRAHAAGHQPH